VSAPSEGTSPRPFGFGGLGSSDYHFGQVLVVLLASIVFQLAAPDVDWGHFVTLALQGAALVLALRAAKFPVRLRRIAEVLAALLVLAAVPLFGVDDVDPAGPKAMTLVLVAVAPVAIIRGLVYEIREERRVTIQSMLAGLCIYLLVAVAFAMLYGAVQGITNEAFFVTVKDGTTADFLYFSFTTMTTTGYGDLTPATDLGRSFAITEMLFGQIYLVTVVALIVANLGRGRFA
jgi:hypothetical protein